MFNPGAYANSRFKGIPTLEVAGRELFVPLKRTELGGEVTGPLADLRLRQVYGFTREQCDQVVEARYRFPLPGDAAVISARVSFGDVAIETELVRREEAEAAYAEARSQGRQAALVTRESADVFTLQVAGIEPDQDVTVAIRYFQVARVQGGRWTLRVPLTAAPRYARNDERGTRQAGGQPLALLRDPGHRFRLDLRFRAGGEVASPTHHLDLSPEGDGILVRLREGEVLPDRDCVLTWAAGPRSLDVCLQEDPASGQVYFLALAPAPAATGPAMPRDVILLVDRSGSMAGAKWGAADWAVQRFLAGLTAGDTFNLGLFHSATRWLAREMRPGTGPEVVEALALLARRDSGGTELGMALEQALRLRGPGGRRSRHLLVITDAQVTDLGRILRLAEQESAREDGWRISVLCIDAAPNSYLALQLAERGGGVAHFLTSDPDEEDITTALGEILDEWSRPAATDLELAISRPGGRCAGRRCREGEGGTVIDLGDLAAGRVAWVVGRVPRGGGDLSFRLAAAGQVLAERAIRLEKEAGGVPVLKSFYGARQLLALEHLMTAGHEGRELQGELGRLGYGAEGLTPPGGSIYPENLLADARQALGELLVREALEYGLVCSETALVAVRREAGQVVQRLAVVASGLAAGWSEDFLSGARFADATLWLEVDRSVPLPPLPGGRGGATVFSGQPDLRTGEAVLFDSSRPGDRALLPEGPIRLEGLRVSLPGGAPVDDQIALLVFVSDLVEPRARVHLRDLGSGGGTRPLNLLWDGSAPVRIILADPAGLWGGGVPFVEVGLHW